MERASASISLVTAKRHAKVIEDALRPEVRSAPPGVSTRLRRLGRGLSMNLEAERLGDLRAALNSYLRLIAVSEELVKLSGKGK